MKITTEKNVSYTVEERFLYECLVSIMGRLFLPDNMSSYAECYNILGRIELKGRKACADIRDIFSEKGITIEKKRLDMFLLCDKDVYMRTKWEEYVETSQSKTNASWEEVYGRIVDFISPLWNALCEDEFYLCDWIGELGRYLD